VLDERDRLVHDLEVHQAELEAQNQELREAQLLLEASRARYADLYDFAPVAYCTLDPAGCVSEINLTGAAMLGKQRSRVIGRPFAIYVSESDRAAFRTHVQHRFASPNGPPAVVELRLVGSAKQPIVIQMVSTVAADAAGTPVGCRSAFTDITEQKRAREVLRLAVQMREDFLAIVSHDLRNPLNSISLGSELLLASLTLDTKNARRVQVIVEAAARMTRMLTDLLDLSSMDAGHLSMDRKLESVDGLLAATVENARTAATTRSVRLETSSATSLVAYCDRDRILQVLMNLVGNAIKFSPANGLVRIEARRKGDEIELAVRDSGEGMEKTHVEHVFDPYWQAPSTAKKGTGLGLSIARGIVEFHGGKIWAENGVDRGCCFFFTLPCTHPEEPVLGARLRARTSTGPLSGSHPFVKLEPEAPSPEGRTVLIVDDELDTRALLTDVLNAEGYDVVTAGDGAQALECLRTMTTLPHLILLDLVMPTMDGWQFLEKRALDRRLAGIPVVLISGQIDARETVRLLGLTSYIEKPIDIASIREALARVHDGPQPTA
jgi:PAS domain S-box-containing protein